MTIERVKPPRRIAKPRKLAKKPESITAIAEDRGVHLRPKPKEDWRKLAKQLPEAKSVPTQRWYGETFYPVYTKLRAKLQALADGST